MDLSYYAENEAPKDFRVSSTTESESHYCKCSLCFTIRKNFYCVDCIKAGNFVLSSVPYSERFADKQAKLLRLKSNRKHVQDRCESLLQSKQKHSSLQTDIKQCKDKIELVKLAIEQRKKNLEDKKEKLALLTQHNNELVAKLPRYQKRVASLGKHTQQQLVELQQNITKYSDNEQTLAALRRERIRQLTRYIFPVYITYDSSDSIEDVEFLEAEDVNQPRVCRERLHIVSASLPADGDIDIPNKDSPNDDLPLSTALGLVSQLLLLLSWTLDVRLATPLSLQCSPTHWHVASGRVCVCALCVCACTGLPVGDGPSTAMKALHRLVLAANTDDPLLGRVHRPLSRSASEAVEAWAQLQTHLHEEEEEAEPEHLSWPTSMQMEEMPQSPSLVTSTAASIASIWRAWTK